FTAPGGKVDLPVFLGVEAFCHVLPGLLQNLVGCLTHGVQRRGVAPNLIHRLQQHLPGCGTYRRSGCIVCINDFHFITLCAKSISVVVFSVSPGTNRWTDTAPRRRAGALPAPCPGSPAPWPAYPLLPALPRRRCPPTALPAG